MAEAISGRLHFAARSVGRDSELAVGSLVKFQPGLCPQPCELCDAQRRSGTTSMSGCCTISGQPPRSPSRCLVVLLLAVGYRLTMSKPPSPTVPDLGALLDEVSLRLARKMGEALSEIGITLRMQCVLLHALEEERSQIEIAELSRLDKTTMVTVMDQLEEAGYAFRKPSPKDRRARIVEVTEAGARIAASGQKVVDRVHQEVLAALPVATQRTLLQALADLADAPADEQKTSASTGVRRRRQPSPG